MILDVQLMPTNDFMDKYVVPEYSAFTAATIPDMSATSQEQGHWLTNFILSGSGLRGVSLADDMRRTLSLFHPALASRTCKTWIALAS